MTSSKRQLIPCPSAQTKSPSSTRLLVIGGRYQLERVHPGFKNGAGRSGVLREFRIGGLDKRQRLSSRAGGASQNGQLNGYVSVRAGMEIPLSLATI